MGVLTKADAQRVEEAIRRAESQSAGEVVVAVVQRCARYGEERLMLAAAWSMGFCLLGYHHLPRVPGWIWVGAQLPLCLGLYAVLRLPFCLRAVVRRRRMEEAVQARAYQTFAQRGIHKTRDRTGLLILISQAEHQVVILGDTGIDAVVGPGNWGKYVDTVVGGIRRGDAAGAIVSVVETLGAMIAAVHPRRPDDANELPDAVVDA